MSNKIRVVVLYGGQSIEHEVSCRSAAFILNNLDRNKYSIHPVAIDRDGSWWPQKPEKLLNQKLEIVPIHYDEPYEEERELVQLLLPTVGAKRPKIVNDLVVFPMLHGTNGEDGSMQGMLDMAGVAYIGADTLSSAVSMDKLVAKVIVERAGVAVVPYLSLRKEEWADNADAFMDHVESKIGFPAFVKPTSLGSSVGVSRVHSRSRLVEAVNAAFKVDEKLLVEEAMKVREIEYAAIGTYDPTITVAGEVISADGFYSYEEKYSAESRSQVVVPAELSLEKMKEGQEISREIFKALQLYGMARIDLFLTKDGEKFYFNEVNTIPGFTSISQYPMLCMNAGSSRSELLDRLIDLAIKRQKVRGELQRAQ